MEITTRTIVIAVISAVIIALILSAVFYLLKNSKQLVGVTTGLNPLGGVVSTNNGSSPTASVQRDSLPVTSSGSNQPASNIKTYNGNNFSFQYPEKWGILTCKDSENIELDPYNSNDMRDYSCDRAIKPITILVSRAAISCQGETIKIGDNTIIRSKTETANWFKNRWCLNKDGLSLDITNRVNTQGITGTGIDDFSSQIETLIKSL